MLRRVRAAQHRSADRLTITGVLESERLVWLSLMETFREQDIVPPTLAFMTLDTQPLDYAVFSGGNPQGAVESLRERRAAISADAVLYGGSKRVDEHRARLSLYTYWHSARGRRIKVAERIDGIVREVDMSGATNLSSWVEELF